jgi:hypothetical protein
VTNYLQLKDWLVLQKKKEDIGLQKEKVSKSSNLSVP